MRKTKIICTLGPATDDEKVLKKLMLGGMNCARLNFSHGLHDEQQKRIDMVKKLREELDLPVALLLDTKGPEIRLGEFKGGEAKLEAGQTFTLTTKDIEGDEKGCSVSYKNLPSDVSAGTRLLIDDGLIAMEIISVKGENIVCKIINGGTVKNKKSVNVPGAVLSMPYMSEKDKSDIIFGIKNDVDFIAASFVRSCYDVLEIKKILEENGGTDIQVIAKIENNQGVTNIDEIIKVSDGIMVARGDMGVEIEFELLPSIQKKLIEKCYRAGKKVITATQMLESMTHNPRPTRAEVSDVANAVYDGTSAVMLSGETAIGAYSVESLETMASIAEHTEADINYRKRFENNQFHTNASITNAISHSAVTTAHDLGATAIITVTESGFTAREVSSFRPMYPIIATCTNPKIRRQLNLSWGVTPIMCDEKNTTDELFEHAVARALTTDIVKKGDIVVITGGAPMRVSGTTNMVKVHLVGDILVSGKCVNRLSVCGPLCVAANEEEAARNFKDGDILVIPETSNAIISILKKAKGIITEKTGETSHAAVVGITLDIPVICGASHATDILKSGTVVTIDGTHGLVYNGVTKIL